MSFYDNIIELLHKDDRLSNFYKMLAGVISAFFTTVQTLINKIYSNFFFDSLDLDGVKYFEKLIDVTPPENQIEYIDGVPYYVCYAQLNGQNKTYDGVVYQEALIEQNVIESPLVVLDDGVSRNEAIIEYELSASVEERRKKIQAKWLQNAHNCIALLQSVVDAWKENEATVDFVDGYIDINFYNTYGVPDYIDTLYELIEEVKPAHLGVRYKFRRLLIEDIHEVKSIEQMENITIDQFMSGVE